MKCCKNQTRLSWSLKGNKFFRGVGQGAQEHVLGLAEQLPRLNPSRAVPRKFISLSLVLDLFKVQTWKVLIFPYIVKRSAIFHKFQYIILLFLFSLKYFIFILISFLSHIIQKYFALFPNMGEEVGSRYMLLFSNVIPLQSEKLCMGSMITC